MNLSEFEKPARMLCVEQGVDPDRVGCYNPKIKMRDVHGEGYILEPGDSTAAWTVFAAQLAAFADQVS